MLQTLLNISGDSQQRRKTSGMGIRDQNEHFNVGTIVGAIFGLRLVTLQGDAAFK
jgi:hypothetical protein